MPVPRQYYELNKISTEPMVVSPSPIYGYGDYLGFKSGEKEKVLDAIKKVVIELIREVRIQYCAAGSKDMEMLFESITRVKNAGLYIPDTKAPFYDQARNDPRWQEVEDYINLPVLPNIPLPE